MGKQSPLDKFDDLKKKWSKVTYQRQLRMENEVNCVKIVSNPEKSSDKFEKLHLAPPYEKGGVCIFLINL